MPLAGDSQLGVNHLTRFPTWTGVPPLRCRPGETEAEE